MVNTLTMDDIVDYIADEYGWLPQIFAIQAICPFGYGIVVVFRASPALSKTPGIREPHPGIAIIHRDGVEIVKETEIMRSRRDEINLQRSA